MTSDNTVSGEMLPTRLGDLKWLLENGFRNVDLPPLSALEQVDIIYALDDIIVRRLRHSTPSVDGEMLEALAPFAAMADWAGEGFADDDTVDAVSYCGLTIGDCRRARAVIARATGAA